LQFTINYSTAEKILQDFVALNLHFSLDLVILLKHQGAFHCKIGDFFVWGKVKAVPKI